MAAKDGVPDETIGFFDGVENGECVREVAEGRKGAELDELAERELGFVEAGFDNVGVDLFESLQAFAFGEKVQTWMALKELVWRVGRGWDMESGR